MSKLFNSHRLDKRNARVYLNDEILSGAQNFNASFASNQTNVKFLGMQQQEIVERPIGPQVGTVNIGCLVVNNDQLIKYTGEAGLNGYVLENSDASGNYSFTSGFLTSYQSRAVIDSIPEINATFSVVGNMGRIGSGDSKVLSDLTANAANINNTGTYKIVDAGNIDISLDDFNTNRVQSYELNINVDRNSFYTLGSRDPKYVKINYPIEVNLSFDVEVDKYEFQQMKHSPYKEKIKDITLNLKQYQTKQSVISYAFSDMKLTAESYAANTEGNIVASVNYRTFLKKLDSDLSAKPALPQFSHYQAGSVPTTGLVAYISTGLCDIESNLGEDEEYCFECISDLYCGRGVCTPTPSNTPSSSVSASNTPSNSATPSATPSTTNSATPTQTPTPSRSSGSPDPTPTPSSSVSPSASTSPSASPTPSVTSSVTPTPSKSEPVLCDNGSFPSIVTVVVKFTSQCDQTDYQDIIISLYLIVNF